jgi:DNA-binding protein
VPENPAVGQQIIFTASSSYDPDGNIVSYDWDFGDENSGSGVNPSHAYAQDGTYTVTLTVTDNDGATDSNSTTVVVGNIAPIVTIHSPLSVTNDSTPLLYATFEEIVASTWYVIDGAAGTGGLNTDNLTVTLPELADGSHSVTVKASDSVGNVGNATQNFLVDTIKPVVTIYPVTSPTNVSFQTITGTFTESGSGIALITVNGVEATISDSTYSATISLTEGTNSVYVIAVDIAGNSDLNTTSIVLDTIPPTITIDAVSSPTNIDYQTVTGTIESGATVEVTCPTATVGTVTYPTDTTWSVEITGMTEDDNVITATARDQAGNTASDTATIVLDITSPIININQVTSPTNLDYQTVTGTMESGATVEVTSPTATVGTVTYPTDTTWSVEITDITESDNVITATATDQAGNTASDTTTIVVDTTLPTITIYDVTTPTNLNYQTVTGRMESGATVEVTCPTATVGTVTYPTGTTWSVEITGMTEGDNVINATDSLFA